MLGKPFLNVLFAFMASAVPVFGAAILLSLTVAGREVPGNSGSASNHAKSTKPSPIEPDRALLASLLEAADTDPVASLADQPEPVLRLSAIDEADTAVPTVALDPSPPSLPQDDATKNRKIIPPVEAIGDSREDNGIESNKPRVAAAQKHSKAREADPPGQRQREAHHAGVYAALARHKSMAMARGSATVTFAIKANGSLSDVRLRQSSGNGQLDRAALQMVRDAAPFSPPPHGLTAYTIRIDFQ
jgi:protein TonB